MTRGWKTFVSLILLLALSSCRPEECTEHRILESSLRRIAISRVMPTFPSAAVRDNAAGVAVAEVHLNEDGKLKGAEILEAPHPEIARETLAAINRWVFKLHDIDPQRPECLTGKLTFYFVIDGNSAYVANPKRFQ